MKNKLIRYIEKHNSLIELVIIFLVLLVYSLYIFFNSCQFFPHVSFDNQILITWQYTSLVGILPYKDIYYPYGILSYWKNFNLVFSIFYLLITPILFSVIFWIIKAVWKKRIFTYFFFLSFFIFINTYTNIFVFNRYGVIVCMAILLAFLFFKKIYPNLVQVFVIGSLTGIIFFLLNDQGLYSVLVFLFFLFVNPIFRFGIKELKRSRYYLLNTKILLIYSIGFFVGCIPFSLYFFSKNMFSQFFTYVLQITDFSIYAKTPFIPYSMTLDNIFIYVSVLLTLFLLIYKLFFVNNNKLSLIFYIEVAMLFVIILLEQKSIIRSLATQITFLALLLFIFLLYELDILLSKHNISTKKRLAYYFCFLLFIFIIGLKQNVAFQSRFNILKGFYQANNECLEKNIKNASNVNLPYLHVKNLIMYDSQQPKIFNYLSDPIFYALFRQPPPYYFTIFEATPLYAQRKNIQYIKDQRVNYIIYNTNITHIADGVPSYARGNILFKYILNNFVFFAAEKNFIILKKKKDADFFAEKSFHAPQNFRDFLLNINLSAIPRSEGMYKASYVINKNIQTIVDGEVEYVNQFLKKNIITSSNKLLLLIPEEYTNKKKEMKVKLISEDNLSTTAVFYRCDIGMPCIINISNFPLFYKERIIKKIDLDEDFKGKVMLVANNAVEKLW